MNRRLKNNNNMARYYILNRRLIVLVIGFERRLLFDYLSSFFDQWRGVIWEKKTVETYCYSMCLDTKRQ